MKPSKYLMKLIQTKIKSTIFKLIMYKLIYRTLNLLIKWKYILFRIEVEEVIAYNTFDQDKNGIVSLDEIYVSFKVYKNKL